MKWQLENVKCRIFTKMYTFKKKCDMYHCLFSAVTAEFLHHLLIYWIEVLKSSLYPQLEEKKFFVQPCDIINIIMFVSGLGPMHFQFSQFTNGMILISKLNYEQNSGTRESLFLRKV